MIDLAPAIRAAILADPLALDIASFAGSKAVFTRRPAPNGAEHPMVFISPQIPGAILDYVSGDLRREVVYDILVYGQNDDATKYRLVEKIGFAIARKFARPSKKIITMPTGFSLLGVRGTNSMVAPSDNNDTIGRMVSVTFLIQED